MDYKGLTFSEKISFYMNKKKYNFKTVRSFTREETTIKEHTIFLGIHKGKLIINPGIVFIHRGKICGEIFVSEKSKAIILGFINGKIISKSVLELRKGCEIIGSISAVEIAIQPGVKFKGNIEK